MGVPSQVKRIFSCKSTFWISGKFVEIIGTPNRNKIVGIIFIYYLPRTINFAVAFIKISLFVIRTWHE